MAICRTSIHTSPAANTASTSRNSEASTSERPLSTITNETLQDHQRALLRVVLSARCVSRQTCTNGTARQHGDQYIYSANLGAIRSIPITAICVLGTWYTFAHYLHWSPGIPNRSLHREITAGNTYFSTEEIFADFCRMNKVIASGVSGPS